MSGNQAGGVHRSRAIRWTALALLTVSLVAISLVYASRDGSAPGARPAPSLEPVLLDDREEMAAYLAAFPRDEYQIADVQGLGRFYIDSNPAQVKKTLLRGKPWEPYVISEFETYAVPGSVALDVGAHIGSLTVPLAQLIGPEGTVYAFEPQKKIYRELVENIALNGIENVVPLHYAVSDENTLLKIDVSYAHDGRRRVGKQGETSEARTIDSFGFSDVSLIKIDVEGHEKAVLLGAEQTIRTQHPTIFIEIWDHNKSKIVPIIEGFGYSLREVPNGRMDFVATYDGEAPSAEAR